LSDAQAQTSLKSKHPVCKQLARGCLSPRGFKPTVGYDSSVMQWRDCESFLSVFDSVTTCGTDAPWHHLILSTAAESNTAAG
jgi:hypothetical protein